MCFVIVFPHPHSPFYVSFSLSVPFLWNRVFPITFPWVRTEVFVTCCPDWPELESELCNTSWHWHGEGSKPSSHQIALSTQEQTYHRLIFFLSPTSAFLLTLVKSPPMHKPVQVQRNIEVHLLISKMILNCSFAVCGLVQSPPCKRTTNLLWFKALFDTSEGSFGKKVSLMDLKFILALR